MKEYIERKEVRRKIRTWIKRAEEKEEYAAAECFEDCLYLLNDAPAANVVEVRHGKNLSEDDPSRFVCSECGWKCWDTYCGDTITYSFCPNCGAKMDKEE